MDGIHSMMRIISIQTLKSFRRVLSLPLLVLSVSVCAYAQDSTAPSDPGREVSSPGAPTGLYLYFEPEISDSIKQRQKETGNIWNRHSPLKKLSLEGPPFYIQSLRGEALSAFEMDLALHDLKEWNPLLKIDRRHMLLAAAMVRILNLQMAAKETYTRLRSERIDFAKRQLAHEVATMEMMDPFLGRRAAILYKIKMLSGLTFDLENFYHWGQVDDALIDDHFESVKNKFIDQNPQDPKRAEIEFDAYVQVVRDQLNEFLKNYPELRVKWNVGEASSSNQSSDYSSYRPLIDFEDIRISFEDNGPYEDRNSVLAETLRQLRLVLARVQESVSQYSMQVPLQTGEGLYAYLYANRGFTVDFNSRYPSTIKYVQLLDKSPWEPVRIYIPRTKIPEDDEQITEVIFDALNPLYLRRSYLSELKDYGIHYYVENGGFFGRPRLESTAKIPEYRQALERIEPRWNEIVDSYKKRTNGYSPDQRYEKYAQLKLSFLDLKVFEEIGEAELSVRFQGHLQKYFYKVSQELLKAYSFELSKTNFKTIQEAMRMGYSFESAERRLFDIRNVGLLELASEVGESLGIEISPNENDIHIWGFEGSLFEIDSKIRRKAEDDDKGEIYAGIALDYIQKYRSGKKPIFDVFPIPVLTAENEKILRLMIVSDYKVNDYYALDEREGPGSDIIQHQIRSEIMAPREKEALAILLRGFLDQTTEWRTFPESWGQVHEWANTAKSKDELLMSVGPDNVYSIIELAARMEHFRIKREDLWWQTDIIRPRNRQGSPTLDFGSGIRY